MDRIDVTTCANKIFQVVYAKGFIPSEEWYFLITQLDILTLLEVTFVWHLVIFSLFLQSVKENASAAQKGNQVLPSGGLHRVPKAGRVRSGP